MDTANEILRGLGRIEGELVEIRKLSERVSKLERWQSWLKGGWAALAVACVYLCKGTSRLRAEACEEYFSDLRFVGYAASIRQSDGECGVHSIEKRKCL